MVLLENHTFAKLSLLVCLCAFFLPMRLLGDNANEALRIINMAAAHPNQGRAALIRNTILMAAAQAKADDLLARNYFSHTDPSGIGPNQLVKNYGYQLPGHYSQAADGNNIESLYQESGYGAPNADRAFNGWLGSPGHRPHILAEYAFYAEQTHVGVGVASNGWTTTYVFITAPPFNNGQGAYVPVDTWTFNYQTASNLYAYYNSIGDIYVALSYYSYYKGLADWSYYRAYGYYAFADYSYHSGYGTYLYYLYWKSGNGRYALYGYYLYQAYAFYYYYSESGNPDYGLQIYNYYLGLANAA